MNTSSSSSAPTTKPARGSTRMVLFVVVIVLAILAVWGIVSRGHAKDALRKETADLSTRTVAVFSPKQAATTQEIVLPGDVQAFQDTPIYAQTTGYLKNWNVDIGAKVKAGQVLAEIDTPEIDSQLVQAQADRKTAQANFALAKVTADRYTNLIKSGVIAKQSADEKVSDAEAKKAATDASQANVDRLMKTQGFKKIVAPFDGVITRRNVDNGKLVSANGVSSGTAGANNSELFHLAAISQLRVFVEVPEIYTPAAVPDVETTLTLSEFPGREFKGKIARTASAIDPVSRTLRIEVDLDNAKGEVLPGAYAQVHLKLPSPIAMFVLPANALLFRADGLSVATLGGDNHIKLVKVTAGRDYGKEIEIAAGLKGDERIVLNPPDSLSEGELVRVAAPAADAAANTSKK